MNIKVLILLISTSLISCNNKFSKSNILLDEFEINEEEWKFGKLELEKSTENEVKRLFGNENNSKEIWFQINSFDFPEHKSWQKFLHYEKKGIIFVLETDEVSEVKYDYKLSAIVFNKKYGKSIKGIQIGTSIFRDLESMKRDSKVHIESFRENEEKKANVYQRTSSLKFYSKIISIEKALLLRKENNEEIKNMLVESIVFCKKNNFRIIELKRKNKN